METTRNGRRTRSRLRHQQIVDAYWHLRALGVDSPAMGQIAGELGDTRVGAVGRLSWVIRSMENRGEWPPKPEAAPGVPAGGNGHTNGHANRIGDFLAGTPITAAAVLPADGPEPAAVPAAEVVGRTIRDPGMVASLNTETAAMDAIRDELDQLPLRSAERIVEALFDQYIYKTALREDVAA